MSQPIVPLDNTENKTFNNQISRFVGLGYLFRDDKDNILVFNQFFDISIQQNIGQWMYMSKNIQRHFLISQISGLAKGYWLKKNTTISLKI